MADADELKASGATLGACGRGLLAVLLLLAVCAGALVWWLDARAERGESPGRALDRFLSTWRDDGFVAAQSYVCQRSHDTVRRFGAVESFDVRDVSELDESTYEARVTLALGQAPSRADVAMRLVAADDGWRVCGVGPVRPRWPLPAAVPAVGTRATAP